MIFSIIVILGIAAIAYFHYTQGLFSATLSAIIAGIAAVLAVSYYETIVYTLLRGRIADYAEGMVLVALFGAIYIVLRVVFDSLVPGNLRLPLYVDRVGAAVMGIVAGVFATGVLTIAAHMLPFGPATPYARYALDPDRPVTVPTGGRDMDALIRGQLREAVPGKFAEEHAAGLIIPVDDMVVGLVERLSTGALSGRQPLSAVHPAFLDELFASRLGIQVGANRIAVNLPTIQQVEVAGVYALDQVAQADGESPQLRGPSHRFEGVRKPTGSDMLLVARVRFSRGADDVDHHVRFSPASVRIVADGRNFMPVGTMDTQGALRVNLPDDYLLVPSEQPVDFVFEIPRDALGLEATGRARASEPASPIGAGAFIEVKRMGVVELAGKSVQAYPGPLESTVIRKRSIPDVKAPVGMVAAAPAVADAPFVFGKIDVSPRLFTEINVGSSDEGSELTFGGGTAVLREGKFARLDVNTSETIQRMRMGDYVISEFFAPPGMKVVQVVGKPDKDGWEWADKLRDFELVDATGARHKPRGGWARVTGAQGSQRMVASYNADAEVSDIAREEGRPVEVFIAFLVPEGTQLTELHFEEKPLAPLNQTVQ